jgi:hypothetical protein
MEAEYCKSLMPHRLTAQLTSDWHPGEHLLLRSIRGRGSPPSPETAQLPQFYLHFSPNTTCEVVLPATHCELAAKGRIRRLFVP